MLWKNSTQQWAWLERVIADHKTHLIMGIYECRRWSSRSSRSSYSLNSDRKESSSIWLSGASQ
jgi:hypothetical protein